MQIFRKASQLGPEETRFYLDTSGWDLSKALAEWRAENRWEAEQVCGGLSLDRCWRTPNNLRTTVDLVMQFLFSFASQMTTRAARWIVSVP